MFRKNVASQFIHLQGVDATTGGIKSGVSWTVRRYIDGTAAAGGGTVTEDGTTGWYKYAMSQADTNGNNIGFNFTGTGAVPQTINIVTTACDPTTATNFGITSLPTTACTTNASLLTSGTGTDQLSVASGRIDIGKALGNAVTTTTNGILDVNTKNINNVAAATPGAAGGILIAGANAATSFVGTAASGSTPAVAALTLTGGAASTTGGGVASSGLLVTGGAGAASTNGAIDGATFIAGGTNTVASVASGIKTTGTSTGHGILATSGGGATGDGIKGISAATNGNGITATHNGTGQDFNATTTPLTLAKTTNITGFNDIAATAIVSSGAITTSGGAVSTVTTVTNQLTAAAIATGVWTDTTAGDFTTALSIGKSIMNGVSLGTGLKIAECVLADTLTTYTGNTPQTGDSFARIGSTGSGLTSLAPASTALSTVQWTNTLATNLGTLAGHDPGTTLGTSTLTQTQVTGGAYSIQSSSCVLGDARIAHLDADVSSRMATYTQPTGFLTATFPSGTIANTTNITAGTITTATNLTTNNDKTGYSLIQTFPTNFSSLSITAAGLVAITSNRKKGATATFEFLMQDATTGAPKPLLTVASVISKDGGVAASTSNSVTEIGLGQYQLIVTATEMTANNIFLQFTSAGAITYSLSVQTQP